MKSIALAMLVVNFENVFPEYLIPQVDLCKEMRGGGGASNNGLFSVSESSSISSSRSKMEYGLGAMVKAFDSGWCLKRSGVNTLLPRRVTV